MHTQMEKTGLQMLEYEMSRQHMDALASFHAAEEMASKIAAHAKSTGRLLLLGMGASHWINRVVEPAYRAAGIDATAQPISEYLRAPLKGKKTIILTSQSGESGEIIKYIDETSNHSGIYGLTLDAQSQLGSRIPSLLGVGGVEKAFAATRSLLISLALHAAVLAQLGQPMNDLLDFLSEPATYDDEAAVEHLSSSSCVVFSSRGVMQGIADAGSLCLMELARIPAFSLEGGQFRHGPFEMLGEGIGVVLISPAGSDADSVRRLAEECVAAGTRPVFFDLSGQDPVDGAVNISLKVRTGLAGAAEGLVAMQAALVKTADAMVPDVGTPVRSTKVTDGE